MSTRTKPQGHRVTRDRAHHSQRTDATRISTQVWAFLDTEGQPLRDKKGRQVHTRLHLMRETFVDDTSPRDTGSWGGWLYPAGTWEAYCPQLLRNGVPYGACNPAVLFSTPELRDHEARKYVLGAARRAFKAAQARGGRQVFGSIRLESEVRP